MSSMVVQDTLPYTEVANVFFGSPVYTMGLSHLTRSNRGRGERLSDANSTIA